MGQKILEKHLTKEAKNSTILHVRKGQWGNLTKIGPEGRDWRFVVKMGLIFTRGDWRG